MSDDELEDLLQDARIIRHLRKIRSVRDNAQSMYELAGQHGSFAQWLAAWPVGDCIGLWIYLHKHFKQLGGQSGPYFLRMAGRDTFLLTDHVVRALNRWGAASGPLKSRADRLQIQRQFNDWQQESGLPLCHISMILANSID
jgi:3-methyladenine DNA glycosylase Tag